MENNKTDKWNFVLAVVLSAVALYAVDRLFPASPEQNVPAEKTTVSAPAKTASAPVKTTAASVFKPDIASEMKQAEQQIPETTETTEEIIAKNAHIVIDTPAVKGTLRLKGARFDNLSLIRYRETLEKDSPFITLFSPAGTEFPYFAEFGWTSNDSIDLPTADTVWKTSDKKLTTEKPVTLTWTNKQGVRFIRQISVDDEYMFTVTDRVENNSGKTVTLFNYGLVGRTNVPPTTRGAVLEGMVGYLDGSLKEFAYDKIAKEKQYSVSTTGGWAGITDKYWMSVLIFDQNQHDIFVKFSENDTAAGPHYQADYLMPPVKIDAGQAILTTARLFAGAKELSIIDAYEKQLNIPRFDLTVDFGWYYFLTKPFFYILRYFYSLLGNMGLAILLFALLLRLAMFPIANKSFVNMARLKKIQPQVAALQERYKDDKLSLNQEMMALYKREKVNPASGCLPMLIQIPVFFSLYKVLYISLDLRQAPFYGWIRDLSARDPSSVFTAFGMLNWPIPEMLNIGIWPLLMGVTMWMQQSMNPSPSADKTQTRILALMPVMMTFLLGNLASGLVIYWTWSNVLAIIQQKAIRWTTKDLDLK